MSLLLLEQSLPTSFFLRKPVFPLAVELARYLEGTEVHYVYTCTRTLTCRLYESTSGSTFVLSYLRTAFIHKQARGYYEGMDVHTLAINK